MCLLEITEIGVILIYLFIFGQCQKNKKQTIGYVSNQANMSHFLGQRVHVQIRLRRYLFLIFLSLQKQPFITTQSQVITVHFVYHCTLFYALTCRSYGNYCNLLKSIVER